MSSIGLVKKLALGFLASTILALTSVTAMADPITITVGNPGNQNTDNVLFNNCTNKALCLYKSKDGKFRMYFTGITIVKLQ